MLHGDMACQRVRGKDDIFVHIDVLKASGFLTLATGEAIAIRVYDGRRGRMAAEVLAWEAPHS